MHLPFSFRLPDFVAPPSDDLPAACVAVRDDLAAFVDDELPTARRTQVVAHLIACDRCHAAERGLRTCIDAIRRTAREVRAPRTLRLRAAETFRQADDRA